jgi:hypothetical protein
MVLLSVCVVGIYNRDHLRPASPAAVLETHLIHTVPILQRAIPSIGGRSLLLTYIRSTALRLSNPTLTTSD